MVKTSIILRHLSAATVPRIYVPSRSDIHHLIQVVLHFTCQIWWLSCHFPYIGTEKSIPQTFLRMSSCPGGPWKSVKELDQRSTRRSSPPHPAFHPFLSCLFLFLFPAPVMLHLHLMAYVMRSISFFTQHSGKTVIYSCRSPNKGEREKPMPLPLS